MIQDIIKPSGQVLAILDTHTPRCALIRFPLATEADGVRCTCGARDSVYGAREVRHGHNIITDAGDQFLAESVEIAFGFSGKTVPTNVFVVLELAEGATSAAPAKTNTRASMSGIISGSQATIASTYPKTSDPDPDNTAATADTLSWRFDYSAPSFSSVNISDGWITTPAPGASAPIYNHFDEGDFGGTFAKTTLQTLKFIINSRFNGT